VFSKEKMIFLFNILPSLSSHHQQYILQNILILYSGEGKERRRRGRTQPWARGERGRRKGKGRVGRYDFLRGGIYFFLCRNIYKYIINI